MELLKKVWDGLVFVYRLAYRLVGAVGGLLISFGLLTAIAAIYLRSEMIGEVYMAASGVALWGAYLAMGAFAAYAVPAGLLKLGQMLYECLMPPKRALVREELRHGRMAGPRGPENVIFLVRIWRAYKPPSTRRGLLR